MTNTLTLTMHLNLSTAVQVSVSHSSDGNHHWVTADGVSIFCRDAESAEGLAAAFKNASLVQESL